METWQTPELVPLVRAADAQVGLFQVESEDFTSFPEILFS